MQALAPQVEEAIGEARFFRVVLVAEDRQRQGLVQTMSVTENMTLAGLKAYLKGPFLSADQEKGTVQDYINKLVIKVSDARQSVMSLSGGNQQKVVIAKSLLTEPKVLMMDEPTRGVDVGAKVDIFKTMSQIATRNRAVLFTSSELKEVTEMSDRVLVLAKGKITADLRGANITNDAILNACVADIPNGKQKSPHDNHDLNISSSSL